MSDDERARRPHLERTEPIRAFGGLFGFPAPPGDGAGVGSFGDVVSRSVELGYRVVDEYVRQGQESARRIGERAYGPESAVQDVQQMTTRMVQYASDFMRLWFDVVQLATSGATRRPPPDAGRPAESPPPPVASPARIRVELASPRRAEVTLDLRADAGTRGLIVHALRAAEPEKPHLSDVDIQSDPDDDALVLRVGVPGDHPAGVYNGLIVDGRTSRPVGTVSVRLGAGA
jgi:hypothetical protein